MTFPSQQFCCCKLVVYKTGLKERHDWFALWELWSLSYPRDYKSGYLGFCCFDLDLYFLKYVSLKPPNFVEVQYEIAGQHL